MSMTDPRLTIEGLTYIALTIIIWSFMYSYNRVFRFGEALLLGLTGAIMLVTQILSIQNIGVNVLLSGNLSVIIPIILGLMMFLVFSKKYNWISRYPAAIYVGVGAALAINGYAGTFVAQIISTVNGAITAATIYDKINEVIYIAIIVATLTYFIFTVDNKYITYIRRIGRYAIMAAFGMAFGQGVMARFSMLLSSLFFIILGIK